MYNYEVVLPAMGEGIIEATITKWLVSKGQHVSLDQPLVEVATDKVDSEIPSPMEGIITRLVYREGEIPRVGEVIALIETTVQVQEQSGRANNHVKNAHHTQAVHTVLPTRKIHQPGEPVDLIVTPLVRMLAKQRGLNADDLRSIVGTGSNGRITSEDVNQYIMTGSRIRGNGYQPGNGTDMLHITPRSDIRLNPGDEIVEMDRMRKIIASHMSMSKRVSPHVTSFLEADVSGMVQWRERTKDSFFTREKARLTFTPLFIEAVALSLKEFPGINVSVNGESIIFRKNINIGVATALADGNLIVPVIRNADHENLGGLSRKISDLANRARNGGLLPEEIKGGTFTITNIGQYNNLTGTPIINQPESAILAFGTIIKKPWAVKTPEGYGVAVRDIIMLSLTYDHRGIDGALGGSFLSSIAHRLEQFNINREV
jgi:2-oxoglutarate dehydrogenase E2 component (dihydrolipoamide succinyltransferase)